MALIRKVCKRMLLKWKMDDNKLYYIDENHSGNNKSILPTYNM